MSENPRPRATDPILIAEVVLGLVLVGLFIVLYFIPAERAFARPSWWSAPLLGAFFFGLLFLDTWRRKRRERSELRETLRQQRETHRGDAGP